MKSKLISIPRNNLLYLPILKLNTRSRETALHATDLFIVAVDTDTEDSLIGKQASGVNRAGTLDGQTLAGNNYIRVEQGLDTTEIPPQLTLDADLIETQYIIEIDNRLGKVADTQGNIAVPSFVDDDNIASYFFSLGASPTYVTDTWQNKVPPLNTTVSEKEIRGPRGTRLEFQIAASLDLATSTFLFERLGSTLTINTVANTRFIDAKR